MTEPEANDIETRVRGVVHELDERFDTLGGQLDTLVESRVRFNRRVAFGFLLLAGALVALAIAIVVNHSTNDHLQAVITCQNHNSAESRAKLKTLFEEVLQVRSERQLAADIHAWETIPAISKCS